MTEQTNTPSSGPNAPAPPTGLGAKLRTQLSIMMLLQYALWGAWWSVLGKYISALEYGGTEIGRIYATTAIASIISPLVFGQIADRWISTQYLLAGLHLAGAVVLYLATLYTDFGVIYTFVLIWAILYVPTISLTNALSFHHIPDAARFFPSIRVFGTIGWIVAGLTVTIVGLDEETVEPILLAAGISFALGLYCLTLPKTPPKGDTGVAFPPLQAIGMLRDTQFAFFIIVSFLISMALAAYFAFCSVFLGAPPLNIESAAGIMTIGQFSEMLLLPLLAFFIRKFGMKWTLLIGMLAWSVRYGIFARAISIRTTGRILTSGPVPRRCSTS